MLANNAKMSISHISHSHSRRYWYGVTPTDHVLHGDRRQVAQGQAREPSPEYGEHVFIPYPQGANTVSLRDVVRGGGGVPRKNVRCCTNALAPNFFMLRPRTIAAPVQWPSPWPYRCPHRVHHAPIALQPTHSCTNALAPNLFMLRPRTIAAPLCSGPALPMPASCPPWPDCPTTNSRPPRHHA